jgi:hypothetical protein
MHRTLAVVVVVLSVAAAVAGVVLTRERATAAESGAVKVSTKGTRVTVTGSARRMLRAYGYDGLQLLTVVGGHAYYRVRSDRGTCYAVGFANSIGVPGAIKCWSAPSPIMDFTLVEASRSDGDVHPYQVEGIAADGIDVLQLVDDGGAVVASSKVQHNVYQFADVRKGAARLVARGANGKEVAAQKLR